MAEIIVPYALTTVLRIQERLTLQSTDFGTPLARIISAVTDYLEGETGRRFKETTYTNESYQIINPATKVVLLKNPPVSSVTSIQYRTGLKSSPNWTEFPNDDWDILSDGAGGVIQVWGLVGGINTLRVSYVGGYKIDFANAGSPTAHTLPFDISDLAERLTVKMFKRRESDGRSSESFQGGTVQWKELLDDVDKQIIARYRQLPIFV